MNALQICGICVISVGKKSSAWIFSRRSRGSCRFLFRYYYVCMNALEICGISVICVGKKKTGVNILTQISLIFYSDAIM